MSSENQKNTITMQLDAFDFDVSMPNMIDGPTIDPVSDGDDNAMGSPFMLGDYSEKEHFLTSVGVIRNEVLECVPLSEIGNDIESSDRYAQQIDGCVAFRCIHCKHATERAEMAVIRPHNLMAIRESFIQFQQTHLCECKCIPSDVRKCYSGFKAREEQYQAKSSAVISMAEDDQFLWVSSAMRRGLRDRSEGGIIYCPEVSARQELESRWQYEENLESDNHQSKHGRQTHWLKNIAQPHKNDVLIGRGRISNDRPGNHYWRKLMKEIKSDYDTRMTGKKSILVRLVVEAVKKQSPPGRFLAQDKGTGLWIEIGDEVAMKKTAQGLRDLGKVRKTAVKVKREGKNKMNKMKYQVVGALVNTDLNTPATKTFAGENDEQCDVVNMLDENVAELIDNERINSHAPKRTKAEHKATANSANTIDMHCYRPQAKLKSKCAATSTSSLEKNAKPDWRVLEESLSDVFHDSSLKKSVRTPCALSGYFGVTKTRGGKYEARFAGYRIGSYVLRADAALAYDGAVRASRLKKRNCKLNFGAEQDYMAARDNELKERHLAVDLWETIEFITSKVNQAVSKNREKFMF